MIKGSEIRGLEHGVEALFVDRWSPRAMSGEPMSEAELITLFEAARWAPSSNNGQPWRILYARRDTASWPLFFDLLVPANQAWCANAAALLLFVSKTTTDKGTPAITHSYDTGAAWLSLALQGSLKGWVVHGMQGFDYAKAKTVLAIPDDHRVEAMAAIGRPGDPAALPEKLRAREAPSLRKALGEIVCEGKFGF